MLRPAIDWSAWHTQPPITTWQAERRRRNSWPDKYLTGIDCTTRWVDGAKPSVFPYEAV